LRGDARRGRLLGFVGKTLIHPKQIQTINECFTPSAAELEEARRIVEAFERAKADGKGAVAFDGKLLDPPIVDRARRMIGGVGKWRVSRARGSSWRACRPWCPSARSRPCGWSHPSAPRSEARRSSPSRY